MAADESRKKVTIRALNAMKSQGRRIAAIGVYDSPTARIADELGFEILMIGNSGPMSLLGYRDSTRIPPEDLLFMTQAVSRVTKYGLIVATMPYMTYQISAEQAMRTAAWLVSEGGAECVQCHADIHSAANVEAIAKAGIPVLAHLGLRSVRKVEQGGFRVQGRTARDAAAIVEDACALIDAGVFAIVVELIPAELTGYLRKHLDVPILSLGSGADADGIYQVSADVTGFGVFPRPKSAAQFVDARSHIEQSMRAFCNDVKAKMYPPKASDKFMAVDERDLLLAAKQKDGI
jgi:3-methyl-2-oxobutanoate hydroxymethyltransferase